MGIEKKEIEVREELSELLIGDYGLKGKIDDLVINVTEREEFIAEYLNTTSEETKIHYDRDYESGK